MLSSRLCSLGIFVAVALLAGCGGSQLSIGVPGAMPQSPTTATRAGRGGSWVLPEAKSETLLYSDGDCGGVCIRTYPDGKTVGRLKVAADNVCSDEQGNVFLTVRVGTDSGSIFEYAHGNTKPARTLVDPGYPASCSVDPTTGNLAVANLYGSSGPSQAGNIAVYKNAQGRPVIYTDPEITSFASCAYDNVGNLFAYEAPVGQSAVLAELPSGSDQFTAISINQSFVDPRAIQWDGANLAIGEETSIYQISVSGSTGTVVGNTTLKAPHFDGLVRQFWVYNGAITAAYEVNGGIAHIGNWPYPGGGTPSKIIKRDDWGNVTISVPPTR